MAKILVIDDEQDIRDKIQKILEYEGFETMSAENGRIGVELAKKHPPDLIICDVLMPELSGYGVLTELRSELSTATIPFIFLTAKATQKDVRHGMSLGADDYLAKPFKISDLLDAIHTRLEKHAIELKQMEELRLTLSSTLPHELKTPLTAIIGFTEFLLGIDRDLLPSLDEILEMQRSIHDCALNLKRLIENYLLYARLKLLEYDPKRREAWQRARKTIGTKNRITSCVTQKAEDLDRLEDIILDLIDADLLVAETDLKKVVEELLDNAAKFSERRTPIHITATVEGEHYLLRITDQGRGMSKEQIANIGAYMQFEREHYEQQGSGLGLIISRMLAQLYGSELIIDSVPNEGTSVTVAFNIGEER
jgi:two-component system sensor histidine kinase/response regulator